MNEIHETPEDESNTCFVVMPFGTKAAEGFPHGYDFDKVYRVIIQRAVRRAGLRPVRADERTGSHIIHGDMFTELRDRKVVLADLSLHNPNVYYELGMRHVMAPRGTVLICRRGTSIPFDIGFSRIIFYEFDGVSLDYEEAERAVEALLAGLLEAKNGTLPDSPVHTLLQHVMPEHHEMPHYSARGRMGDDASSERYQQAIAAGWRRDSRPAADLLSQETSSTFGVRALAYWCLQQTPLAAETSEVADICCDFEQHDLGVRLFEALEHQHPLGYRDLLRFGSAIYERAPDLRHVNLGLNKAREALALILPAAQKDPGAPKVAWEAAHCYRSLAGLQLFKAHHSRQPKDLEQAIEYFNLTVQYGESEAAVQENYPVGKQALARLRLMLLLRQQEKNPLRPDTEGHREVLLSLRALVPPQRPKDGSYLRWYQAIALADAGNGPAARPLAHQNLAEDSLIRDLPEHFDVGRKQYTHLRRIIEQDGKFLRHPALFGFISQVLQGALAEAEKRS